jgi:hypothetical protein
MNGVGTHNLSGDKIKKTFDGMEIIRNKHIKCVSIITFIVTLIVKRLESHQRKGAVVIGFTTTCAIGVYHHLSCEFQPRSILGLLSKF